MRKQLAVVAKRDDLVYVTRMNEKGLADDDAEWDGWEEWTEFAEMEDALAEVQHIFSD